MQPRFLLLALLAAPALGQDPKLPDGVCLRLGTDRFRETSRIDAVAVSPDVKRVAVRSGGDLLRILDVPTGAELRRFPLRDSEGTPNLLFTLDGKRLVTGDYSGVNLWDAETGRLVRTVGNHGQDLGNNPIQLSPDGKAVIVGSRTGQGPIQIIDLGSGAVVASFGPIYNSHAQGTMSPDGRLVAVWGVDAPTRPETSPTVQLFDAKSGAEKARLKADVHDVYSVAFSPDGTRLATGGRGAIQLWDIATEKAEHRIDLQPGQGWNLTFSPDGKFLSTTGKFGLVETWSTATGKQTAICKGPVPLVFGIQYRPDGQLVAWGRRSNALDLWEVPSGKRLSPGGGHTAPATALSFSPDGKTLISSSEGETLRWDVATGKELGPLELTGRGGRGPVPRQFGPIHFSPDGKYLIANDADDNRLSVWDVASGAERFSLDNPAARISLHPNCIFAFALDSSRLASINQFGGRNANPIPVWDLGSGKLGPNLAGQPGHFTAAAFSTDGATLATAAHRYAPEPAPEVWVWDVAAGKTRSKVTLPRGNFIITRVVFLDDRLYVPFVGAVQAQKVYDALTGQVVGTLEGLVNPSQRAVVLSPDRRLLAVGLQGFSAAREGAPGRAAPPDEIMVRVYETATGSARHDLAGQTGRVTAAAFSRDGKTLAVGCNDTTILLWDLAGPPRKVEPLSPADLKEAWAALNDPGAKRAEQAMRKLAARPAEAVPYLAGQAKPAAAPTVTAEEIAKSIADLDAGRFAVREAARLKLERLGAAARPAVVEALKRTDLTPETRERLEKVKSKMDEPVNTAEWVRPLRVVEVLERIGSAEAVAHLKVLAGGVDAPSTRAARAALSRLGR
jgi:WD40 repeat protein